MPIEHLPTRMQPAALRVRDWCLTNGPALIILGGGIIARGVSYIPGESGIPSPASHPAEMLLPIGWWAVIWITIGVVCLIAAAVPRVQPAAVGAGVGLHSIWALSFLADSIAYGSPRGWIPAVGYASIALLVMWSVWRGSREIIPEGAVARELRRA